MSTPLRVLIVGCGNMGASHAKAYAARPDCEIVGLVSRTEASRSALEAVLGRSYPGFSDYSEALAQTRPDIVCISTYPDTHAAFAIAALEAGAHVFVEKPLAETVEEAAAVRDTALRLGRKLAVGYILRQHPSWTQLIELARTLGKPLVMRMNLNQQSSGSQWQVHKNLMNSLSPIVDCGVHYVDVMCQMTRSRPVRVHAIGARLSEELKPGMVNYGCLQVTFEDGSVGWYEAGWGPMMSQEAYFIKDVVGPKGSVSIVSNVQSGDSDNIADHTKTGALRLHHAPLNAAGEFAREDDLISTEDEPDHDALCALEQAFLVDAIVNNADLKEHLDDAVNSLRIVLAADRSMREGRSIDL